MPSTAVLRAHECHCGMPDAPPGTRVIPIRSMAHRSPYAHCARAGFETIVSIPIRLHERLMGEVDLFFHAGLVSESERSLLEALASHLASAMETFACWRWRRKRPSRRNAASWRSELHDSIAQSLAFLKIQVQLMQDALDDQDASAARACWARSMPACAKATADVRELLVHFRTRANAEDIEPALLTTLRKFEHQSGIRATLNMDEHGMPLHPDVQIQVLHIVQEALSNVRKHADAPARSGSTCSSSPSGASRCATTAAASRPATDRSTKPTSACASCRARRSHRRHELEVFRRRRSTSLLLTLPWPPPNRQTARTEVRPFPHDDARNERHRYAS
jgi:two-component sensor histidine kinase